MTTSELWGRASAERYDVEESEMGSASVLGPAVDFLAELAGEGRALELAVGTGRVGVPLWERGVPVAGVELSPHMVEVLRRKVDEDALPVVVGDMATTVVPGEFTLVYLVYNTISNLLTQDEQVECFRNAARHLAPGGRFVVELGVPPLRFLSPGQVAVPFDVSEGHFGFDTLDPVEQILVSHHFTREGEGQGDGDADGCGGGESDRGDGGGDGAAAGDGDADGSLGRYRRDASRHRYVWPSELDLMARIAGLERERRVADWDGSPFREGSPKHVSVWRKPV